jgi:hypothetical protein
VNKHESCVGEQVWGKRFNSAAFAYVLSGKLCRVAFKGRTTQIWFMSSPLNLLAKAELE